MRQIIIWAWITVCFLDVSAGVLGWLEMRKETKRVAHYLGRVMMASAVRSGTTIVGLYAFGVNVKTHLWFLVLGLIAVTYKAIATWGWIFYCRDIINGSGWWGLVKRMFRSEKTLG